MKKVLLFKLIILSFSTYSFSQINHDLTVEFASPSYIFDYPDQSQLLRLGYQPRLRLKHFEVGTSLLVEHHRFKMLLPQRPARTIDKVNLKGWGARMGTFIGREITSFISINLYHEYGEYASNIYVLGRSLEHAAVRSHTLGFHAKYKWLNHWHLGIKIGYENYELSRSSIFQAYQNFGQLIFRNFELNDSLVNGVLPTLTLQYTIDQ
ncbi:MAG: hypothetical protein AAF573_22905 [Bacteroidota bacterium]